MNNQTNIEITAETATRGTYRRRHDGPQTVPQSVTQHHMHALRASHAQLRRLDAMVG